MLAGRVKGCKTSLSSMFEAVGSYAAGKITKEELDEFENKHVLHVDHVLVCTQQTL